MSESNERSGRPYGVATIESPENVEIILERLSDPTYLPSLGELECLGSHAQEGWRRIVGEPGGWRRYEIPTQEYVAALADLLLAERERFGRDGQFTVLEVGAGDGSMSYFLERELERRQETVRVVCTDSGAFFLRPLTEDYHVEPMTAADAVVRFRPDVVLSSWMPAGADFTECFRAQESVGAYVLIGLADTSYSGLAWQTWGAERGYLEGPTPFERDGFRRERVSLGTQYHFRSLEPGSEYRSQTNVFRRQVS